MNNSETVRGRENAAFIGNRDRVFRIRRYLGCRGNGAAQSATPLSSEMPGKGLKLENGGATAQIIL